MATLSAVSPARGDWINLTGAEIAPNIAEITVFDDRVEVVLEVYVGDLKVFKDLVPDDWLKDLKVERPPLADRLKRFSERGLRFVTDKGETLQAELRLAEPRLRKDRFSPFAGMVNPYTRLKVPEAPADKRVLYAELVYPFREMAPKTLTISPPLDAEGQAEASIGFIVYHKAVPVIDFRYLSGPSTLTLDPDPWYSKFDNPNLSRHHKDALMSFLYVEPREVRHEIIFRLRDLEEWTDLDLGDTETLTAAQIAALEEKAERYFAALNPLIVDGKEVTPSSVKAMVLEIGASGVTIVEDPKAIDRATALMGVILSYPHRVLPKTLALTWQLFTKGAQTIPVSVADPAGAVPGGVTPEDPEVTWTNFLRTWQDPEVTPVTVRTGRTIPIVALLFFGLAIFLAVEAFRAPSQRWRWAAPAMLALLAAVLTVRVPVVALPLPGGPDNEAAKLISDAILKNAATAMLETQPETFNAALKTFVAEEEIGPVSAEMRRGLSVRLPSGARALTESIEDVKVEKIEPNGNGVNVVASWTANVSGGHWGHLHRLKIHYRGLMDFEETSRVWKLRGLSVLSARPAA